MATNYRFRLEKFEGPLDMLLSLIEKEKLDITQVSLAQVADQYLEYIRQEEQVTLENLSAFLTIAARLILIKSRALLPVLSFTEEEEQSMDDLEFHLKTYRLFRNAARALEASLRDHHPAYERESLLGTSVVFYPPTGLTKDVLREHFFSVLGEIPLKEILPEKEIAAVITLEERIAHLRATLLDRMETSFHQLIQHTQDRIEVIVSFLAMLELIKQRFIHVEQKEFFSEIRIKRLV